MATIVSDTKDLDLAAPEATDSSFQESALPSREWMLSQFNAGGVLPTINSEQLISISAMISYIAAKSGQSEFRIERNLSDMFNVANAKRLPAAMFDKAMCYLVDVLPDESRS